MKCIIKIILRTVLYFIYAMIGIITIVFAGEGFFGMMGFTAEYGEDSWEMEWHKYIMKGADYFFNDILGLK